ncbi:LamG-like jellyroll fold domain-containing protein [Luteimonas salinilitoris]|uniref:LamG-like jellyroll fold domain-containing protein n=1 Tax=Luteimonas salinilitoris TaxID=3237697 RepID=A0ABV4HLB6_9GAMM
MLQRLQCIMCGLVFAAGVAALVPASAAEFGSWNAEVPAGGVGLEKPLPENSPLLAADARWTAYGWINATRSASGKQPLAGLGDPDSEARCFMAGAGRPGFWWGADRALSSNARLQPGRWHFQAASARDGELTLPLDGRRVASGPASASPIAPAAAGPHRQPSNDAQHFAGRIAGFTVGDTVLDAARVAALARTPPDASTRCEPASPSGRCRRGRWPGR